LSSPVSHRSYSDLAFSSYYSGPECGYERDEEANWRWRRRALVRLQPASDSHRHIVQCSTCLQLLDISSDKQSIYAIHTDSNPSSVARPVAQNSGTIWGASYSTTTSHQRLPLLHEVVRSKLSDGHLLEFPRAHRAATLLRPSDCVPSCTCELAWKPSSSQLHID
jgi:hypothetical protein